MTKYGDQITYSTADMIADLEKKGYVLVNNEFDQTGQTLGQDNDGQIYTVNYTPNGHIIPVDEQGNPIPGAPTPTYTTDQTDPTKVTPNEKVPEIPGYVATVSTVTPTDPTQNTKVTYVKKDAALTVLFLDKTTGTTLATVNVDGKYGD